MKNHVYFYSKILLFVSSFILVSSTCLASYKHISFEVLNKDDGLNNNTIYSIMKDRNDCMWFATDMGLSKYDGMFFSNFALPDIIAPVVRLYEFDEGIILAQTTTGLVFAFDYLNERQMPIVCNDPNITDHPISIAPFGGKSLYATGPTGLFDIRFRVDRSANELHFEVRKIPGVAENLLFAATDPKGRLFSYVKGTTKILCYDPRYNGIRYIDFGDSHRLELDGSVDRMRAFDDNLWIGLKYDGVLCYDFKTDKVVKFTGTGSPRPLFSRNYNYVLGVDKYNDSTYFAATQKGTFRMKFDGSVVDNKFDLTMAPSFEPVSRNLIESESMCVYVDKKRNLVWVGTFGGGVIKYDLNNEFYDHINMGGVEVNSMFEDQKGYLWLATSGLGILRSDTPKLNKDTKFKLWGNLANDPTGRYVAKRDNSSGLILFGQSDGNVLEFDNLSGEVQHYKLRHPKNPKLRVVINGVFTDSKQRRWVATAQGLYSRRESEADYQHLDLDTPAYGNDVSTVVEDTQGDIWIGTSKGVARLGYDASGGVVIALSGLEDKFGGIGNTEVCSMFVNAKGQVIVGYVDRIYRINNGADSVEYICSLSDNLPDGHITCMVDDKMGNTWFGTNAGMINIRSSGKHVFNYSSEGAMRSTCRLRDGRLVWSGSNGLMFFYPAIAYNDHLPSKLVLSAIYMGRTQIQPGVEYENGAKIEQNLAQTERIELPYSKSALTIFVSDLQYSITPKRISYMLEPLMDSWATADSRVGVNFQWLPKGEYTLRVKSQFHDDTLGEESAFRLVITPPWYDSWWMWIIYLACGLGVLLLLGMAISKHIATIKEWYMGKIIEVSDSHMIELQDQGKDMVEAQDGQKSILVVSSDKHFVRELERSLGDTYRLIKSSTIAEGFFAAMENVPSIIMCDTKVQGESGIDYCCKVKENLQTCHIPLLMFGDGAQGDLKAHQQNADRRADAYLSKADGIAVFGEMFVRMLNNRDVIRKSVANYIGHHNDEVQDDAQSTVVDRDSEFVRELIEIVENNIDSPDFNVKRLAELTNMSQSTLYRRVMQNTQTSIAELIRDVRLNRAAKLLRENSKFSVQQVAEMVGYNDMATFRKHFNSMFGVTPSKYPSR